METYVSCKKLTTRNNPSCPTIATCWQSGEKAKATHTNIKKD